MQRFSNIPYIQLFSWLFGPVRLSYIHFETIFLIYSTHGQLQRFKQSSSGLISWIVLVFHFYWTNTTWWNLLAAYPVIGTCCTTKYGSMWLNKCRHTLISHNTIPNYLLYFTNKITRVKSTSALKKSHLLQDFYIVSHYFIQMVMSLCLPPPPMLFFISLSIHAFSDSPHNFIWNTHVVLYYTSF